MKNGETGLVVKRTETGLHGMDSYLVRGVGKRAIHVVVRPFHGIFANTTDEELAVKGAQYAAQKGWKNAIIEPDMVDGECAEIFNVSQHTNYVYGNIAGGKYLCFVGRNSRRLDFDFLIKTGPNGG